MMCEGLEYHSELWEVDAREEHVSYCAIRRNLAKVIRARFC
jgi:hypothetical protein